MLTSPLRHGTSLAPTLDYFTPLSASSYSYKDIMTPKHKVCKKAVPKTSNISHIAMKIPLTWCLISIAVSCVEKAARILGTFLPT